MILSRTHDIEGIPSGIFFVQNDPSLYYQRPVSRCSMHRNVKGSQFHRKRIIKMFFQPVKKLLVFGTEGKFDAKVPAVMVSTNLPSVVVTWLQFADDILSVDLYPVILHILQGCPLPSPDTSG